ncbi:MAG TPA: hypothetical protein VNC11_03455 [Gemmatimonadaceae bacterium]|jgi:hypothetical protein|nr:hypothetical protein [Gemmatimonadaceae bacterium]
MSAKHVDNGCQPEVALTAAERRLVQTVLFMRTGRRRISPEQRSILFQICSSSTRHSCAPEEFLVAFKHAIFGEADAMGIPLGIERNDLISDLISALIEEMYKPAVISATSAETELRSR